MALVVYLYGYPTTAAEVLMGLVAIDLILVLLLNSNG
ncbi:phage-related holin [Thermococcus stetteri]|nr:phage-related holin [Thermococcus stetteri]